MVALPNGASRAELLERGKRIYDEVRAGRFQHAWCPLTISDGVDTLELFVSCDALRMPVTTTVIEDGVQRDVSDPATRVDVDAFTQQEIADLLGAVLLTPLLVDRIYRASPKLSPSTRTPGPQMASVHEMILHSQAVDRKLLTAEAQAEPAEAPRTQPIANVGKDWVLAQVIFSSSAVAANKSANYGWLGAGTSRSVTGLSLWQSVGTAHNAGLPESPGHVDYSQTARYAHRFARLNGAPVDLGDVYTGRVGGTRLVSHEGPLPSFRIPQAQGAPPPAPDGPPGPGLPSPPPSPPPPPPPGEEPPQTAKKAKKDPTGRVVGGGLVGAGIGWVAGGPFGALVGGIIGGIAGGVTK